MPLLQGVKLYWTPKNAKMVSSQQWHMGGGDIRQLKLFLYLNDIDEGAGPLTIIPEKESRELVKKYDYVKEITRRSGRGLCSTREMDPTDRHQGNVRGLRHELVFPFRRPSPRRRAAVPRVPLHDVCAVLLQQDPGLPRERLEAADGAGELTLARPPSVRSIKCPPGALLKAPHPKRRF